MGNMLLLIKNLLFSANLGQSKKKLIKFNYAANFNGQQMHVFSILGADLNLPASIMANSSGVKAVLNRYKHFIDFEFFPSPLLLILIGAV